MPTNRQRVPRTLAAVITDQVANAWRMGDKHNVNRALDIDPGAWSPFDVQSPTPPAWLVEMNHGTDLVYGVRSYLDAWRLRTALIEVAGPPGRSDPHGQPLEA